MSSPQSIESRIGRFRNADSLIQNWADYNAQNPLITKAALSAFILDVETKNNTVTITKVTLGNKQQERKKLFFFDKRFQNTDCFIDRLIQIVSYINSLNIEHEVAYEQARTILRTVTPGRIRQKKGEKKVKHRIRRSFNGVLGLARETVSIISNIPPALYNPPNPNLSVTAMETLIANMETANAAVNIAEVNYGNAVNERQAVYKSMNTRITLIKNYLASFTNGKQSDYFLGFKMAIESWGRKCEMRNEKWETKNARHCERGTSEAISPKCKKNNSVRLLRHFIPRNDVNYFLGFKQAIESW